MTEHRKLLLDDEEDLKLVFDDIPDPMYLHDLAGNLTRINPAFERVLGLPSKSLLGKSFYELIVSEHRSVAVHMVHEQFGGAPPRSAEFEVQPLSGNRFPLVITMRVYFVGGSPVGIVGLARPYRGLPDDLYSRSNAEIQLLQKTAELARFSRHLQLLHRLSTTNYHQLEDLFSDYLGTGAEIFGAPIGVIMQWADRRSTPRAVFSSHDSPHPGIIDLHSAEIIRTRRTLTYVANLNRPYSFYVGTPILIHDQVYGTIGFFDQTSPASPVHPQVREIIELMAKSIAIAIHQRNLTDQLAYQAQHDALTGLPNRLLLKDRLDNALDRARRNQGMVAVVFLDLDRFKQINDTLGHSIGDMLLQHVARRLRRCVGENDCLARMGGDEFTAILTGCQTQEQAAEIVRSLLTAIRKPSFVEGYELFVTASIGISFYPKDGRDAATLLRNADSAMYYTKNSGKDDFHFFSSENSETAREHLELENYLRRALANNELTIYYQPQVGINGILASFEVLLVWDHPKLGRISPTVFIPIAEESGMILQIGAWVLGEACRKVASWIESGISPVPVAVNVSALQFAQADFVSTVERVLLETSIDASLLELELTESLLMKDVEQSARRMAEIRALGVKISIDDFGTGYSSLSYLRRLPADSLKIDRSFLQDADRGHGRLSLIQTIVLLAHNMGLSVTAEGVEDSEQFELVRLAGCDKVQGHYFGAPLHSDTAEMLLKNQPGLTDSLPS